MNESYGNVNKSYGHERGASSRVGLVGGLCMLVMFAAVIQNSVAADNIRESKSTVDGPVVRGNSVSTSPGGTHFERDDFEPAVLPGMPGEAQMLARRVSDESTAMNQTYVAAGSGGSEPGVHVDISGPAPYVNQVATYTITATVPSDSEWLLNGKLDAANVEVDGWFAGAFSILSAQPAGYEIVADDTFPGMVHVRWPLIGLIGDVPFVASVVALPTEERQYVTFNALVSGFGSENYRESSIYYLGIGGAGGTSSFASAEYTADIAAKARAQRLRPIPITVP